MTDDKAIELGAQTEHQHLSTSDIRHPSSAIRNPSSDIRHPSSSLLVIGLLGGVASGKSLVAKKFCELGAELLDGDRTGHEVLRFPEVEQAARVRWGDTIFNAEGRIERKRLARIVFAPPPDGPPELEYLERLTHPRIFQGLLQRITELAASGRVKAVVLDAPVMLKAGWNRLCDKIVFVDAPREVRLSRARSRGWSDEDFSAREEAQESLEQKRQIADVEIDNSGSVEFTERQVERLWHSLVG